MDLELAGKHVLITGGSKGIGLACARGFLQEGARVSLVARNADTLAQAALSLTDARADADSLIATFPVDLGDAQATVAALDRIEQAHGPVDVLVNAAGAARRTPPDELTAAKWHAAMEAKYFTYVHVMDPLVKRMAARGAGAIVNVVGAGGKVASPTHLAGGAANAALMLASAGLANAYASRGVRVNVVNPGPVATERLHEGARAEAQLLGISPEEALARAHRRQPLGRVAEPREIADAVLFLASARASYITGAVIAMDGAMVPAVV
ncbi:SDR family oxidoreductase [Xenophilus sp. Marseille-Q4582]|uniref:SDR family oxidoreductase n=1 Tax=Xenophilus sp. Marseille-Q4582 TaxID=2866600 RepID=UPI001CE467CC|nr:SDR family oxidoreductase [Xenophilus sp. Marseille-Q4582]